MYVLLIYPLITIGSLISRNKPSPQNPEGNNNYSLISSNKPSTEKPEGDNSVKRAQNNNYTVILVGAIGLFICVGGIYSYLRKKTSNATHFNLEPNDHDQDFIFDIFITYAQPDCQIMEQMYQSLINDFKDQKPFQVAFNEKDFIPGKYARCMILILY